MEKKLVFFSALKDEVVRGFSPSRSQLRSRSAKLSVQRPSKFSSSNSATLMSNIEREISIRPSEDLGHRYFQQLTSAVGYCHARGVFDSCPVSVLAALWRRQLEFPRSAFDIAGLPETEPHLHHHHLQDRNSPPTTQDSSPSPSRPRHRRMKPDPRRPIPATVAGGARQERNVAEKKNINSAVTPLLTCLLHFGIGLLLWAGRMGQLAGAYTRLGRLKDEANLGRLVEFANGPKRRGRRWTVDSLHGPVEWAKKKE